MKSNFLELLNSKFNKSEYSKVTYYKGEIIFLKENKFLILNKGRASLEIINDNFNNFKITEIKYGEIIAPLFQIDKMKNFLVEIIANEDVEVIEVDQKLFISKLIDSPDDYFKFFQYLSNKATKLFQKIIFSTMTIEEKFLNYLRIHKVDKDVSEIPTSITEVSKELFVTRTALYKVINKLIEDGHIIKISSKKFKIIS